MFLSHDPVVNLFIGLTVATFAYSVLFNMRCAIAILVSLVTARFFSHHDVNQLHMIGLIVSGFIAIGTIKGIKPTLLEVESNEVNYIIFVLLWARVGALTLHLMGFYGVEIFFRTTYSLLLTELIILGWSVHYGIPERFSDTVRYMFRTIFNPHLAKVQFRQKTN